MGLLITDHFYFFITIAPLMRQAIHFCARAKMPGAIAGLTVFAGIGMFDNIAGKAPGKAGPYIVCAVILFRLNSTGILTLA